MEKIIGYLNNKNLLGYISKYTFGITVSLLVLASLLVLFIRIHNLNVPVEDLVAYEPNVIYTLQNYITGNELYTNPEKEPFAITQYTPLYYKVCGLFAGIIGTDCYKPLEVFFLSRLVSLLFNVLSAILIFVFLFKSLNVRPVVALIGAIVCFIYIEPHAYTRPDSVYHFFFILSVYLFYLMTLNNHSVKYLIATSLFVIITIFSKQTGLILIFINTFYVLITKQYRLLALQTILYIVFFSLFLIVMTEDISLFLMNVVGGVNNGIDLIGFYPNLIKPAIETFHILIPLIIIIALYWVNKSLSMFYLSLIVLGAFGWALITGTKWGSTPSYFSDFINVGFMLVLLFYDKMLYRFNKYKIAFSIIILFIVFSKTMSLAWQKYYKYDYSDYYKSEAVAKYMKEELNIKVEDKVFCFKHSWMDVFLFENSIMPHKEVITRCYSTNALNYSYARELISKGGVKYIVSKQSLPISFLSFKFDNYVPIKQINDYYIYKVVD